MSDFIPTKDSVQARKTAISNEFDRLIKELMSLGVIRKSMLGDRFYVIYTEDGPMDITIKRLAPCLRFYPGTCLCQDCSDG